MCGRYAFSRIDKALLERLEADGPEEVLEARWNVAPGQKAPVLRHLPLGRRLEGLGWGFPRWDGKGLLVNARVETAARLPAFRGAFAGMGDAGRCLVPLTGWYEWKREGRLRQPHFLKPTSPSPLLMAGLWTGSASGPRFTVLTCPASASIAHIHPRMPLILPEGLWTSWLVGDPLDQQWTNLLRPWPDACLEQWEVGPEVNGVGRDHPGLVAPAQGVQGRLF